MASSMNLWHSIGFPKNAGAFILSSNILFTFSPFLSSSEIQVRIAAHDETMTGVWITFLIKIFIED